MYKSALLYLYLGMSVGMYTAHAQIKNSEQLIGAMHAKYANNFNSNITFIQINQDIAPDGKVSHSLSYEAFHYPGKFRVDFGPAIGKDGYIVSNDTLYMFKNGFLVERRPCIMDVGLLTGDIYFMPVEDAIKECKKHGYDLSKFREDTYRGNEVYVVGANDKNDTKSPQFWIDKEELYVVRNINFSEEDNKLEDIHYLEHTLVEKAWVEERIEIYSEGKLIRKEHYAEVKSNNDLNMDIFKPSLFTQVHWREVPKTKKK